MPKLADYLRLARMDKPSGALLLLWPTLWGLWMAAEGWPGWRWLAIFVAGVAVMRAFGCVVNDIADRNLDPLVARTKNRPLAAGRITLREAVAVGFVLLLCAFGLWQTLPETAKRWAIPALAVAVAYPFAKRVFALPQAALGVAFSFGIPMAFAAVRDAPPPPVAWVLFFANALWVMAYDTIYAMADREDDLKIGVKSAAIFFGEKDVAAVSVFYALCVSWLSLAGAALGLGLSYYFALLAAMGFAFYFYRAYRTRDPDACMSAFRANHWFGAAVFAGFASAGRMG